MSSFVCKEEVQTTCEGIFFSRHIEQHSLNALLLDKLS